VGNNQRGVLNGLKSIIGYVFVKGLYGYDSHCLKLPKVHYKERRVPKDDEVEKLFQVTENDDDRLSLLLLVDCGIRVTELATIKLKNVDLNNASILINGKGYKDRTVYLSETTIKYLRNYLLNKKGEYLFSVIRADAQIKHRSRRFFEDRLTELCVKAGVDHITPHQLRHYFATHTLSNGADVKAVSAMLGHADAGIPLKIYHHVNVKSIREMHREFSPLANILV
jgi:site-specific recombinase XerD